MRCRHVNNDAADPDAAPPLITRARGLCAHRNIKSAHSTVKGSEGLSWNLGHLTASCRLFIIFIVEIIERMWKIYLCRRCY